MSASPINLYCNEQPNEVVSSAFLEEIVSSNLSLEDENYIDSIFLSEIDQMPQTQLVHSLIELRQNVSARKDVVNWMLKVQSHYQFRPETVHLSINYLDRFLLFHSLPEGKEWPMQLLAVACLSIAAKMEETRVQLLVDLQILEPKILFKSKTIQRMELLVMSRLKWRLNLITPLHFLHYFITKLPNFDHNGNNLNRVFSRSSDIVISLLRAKSFLEFTPSAIAAATVLWVTDQTIDIDDSKLGCFHKRLNRDMVKRCYELIKKNMSKVVKIKGHNKTIAARCKAKRFYYKEFKSTHDSPANHCNF